MVEIHHEMNLCHFAFEIGCEVHYSNMKESNMEANQKPNLAVENDHETKKPRYVLQLSCGLTCELILDGANRRAICIWSQRPTWKQMASILREYPRWRDDILDSWEKRGKISRSKSTPKILIAKDHDKQLLVLASCFKQ